MAHSQNKKQTAQKATQKELAEYLGVTPGAVSQYDQKKRKLMLLGLAVLRANQ